MVFSLLLTITIMVAEGKLEQSHVLFLFGGAQARNIPPNPVMFLSPQAWSEFNGWANKDTLKNFLRSQKKSLLKYITYKKLIYQILKNLDVIAMFEVRSLYYYLGFLVWGVIKVPSIRYHLVGSKVLSLFISFLYQKVIQVRYR